jgi:FtsH-binding integral membrane protein
MLSQNAAPSLPVRDYSAEHIAAGQAAFIRKVYAFMAGGLGTTALAALTVAHSESLTKTIFGHGAIGFYLLLLAELVMVMSFSSLARRLSSIGAATLFYIYSIMNGLTISVAFLIYTKSSIASTFFVTAGTFAGVSAYGFLTKRNLASVGNFMLMGLWGLILATLANMFLGSAMLDWMITYAGVLIFVGLTAWDTQKIKELTVVDGANTDEDHKYAIHGALILYLDFINLFWYLLRLLGRRR